MVFPVIVALALLFLVAVYFAVTYWYITLPIVVLAVISIKYHRIRKRQREELEFKQRMFAEEQRQEEREQRKKEARERQREEDEKNYERYENAYERFRQSLDQYAEVKHCMWILGLDGNVRYSQIKKRYRELALKFHPDKNKSSYASEKFKDIHYAYSKLKEIHEQRIKEKIKC